MAKDKTSGSTGGNAKRDQSAGRQGTDSARSQSGRVSTENMSNTHNPPKTKPGGGKDKK